LNLMKRLHWKSWHLPYKLILLYTPLIIIPVISGVYFLTSSYNASNRDTVTEYSKELLKLISAKIDDRMSVMEEVSFQIFWVPEIQQFLQSPPDSPYELVTIENQIKNRVDAHIAGSEKKDIKAVVIISPNHRVVIGEDDRQGYLDGVPSFKQIIRDKKGRVEWFLPQTFETPSSEFEAFRLARIIRNEKLKEIGMIYLVLDAKMINDFFRETRLGNDVEWQLLTRKGEIILDQSFDHVSGQEPIMISQTLKHNGWVLKVNLPMHDLYETIQRMGKLALWIAFFCLCIGLFATYTIAVDIIVPIRKLMHNMRKGIKGAAPSDLQKIYGAREIIELNDTFISVMYEIHNLIQEVIKNQTLQREAEMKALQNQLSPHFLYNTINTVRWMALLQGQNNIKEIIDSLSKLLTYSLRNTDELVPLSEELSALNDYVNIQKARYQNFQYVVDMDEVLNNQRVLKFLIQPLIENALIHGLSHVNRSGKIHINIYRKGDIIEIRVTDNGRGMTEEDLNRLLIHLKQEHSKQKEANKHIGLRNVNERIQMHYGGAFGIAVKSEFGEGTCVTISLPWEEESHEKNYDR
jgi:two-component system sensor histidine kinase YesM